MWGAKVMLPCDMPDDILEDSIKTSKQLLTEVLQADRNEGLQKQGPKIVETLKKQFDAKWGQNWHVVCGKRASAATQPTNPRSLSTSTSATSPSCSTRLKCPPLICVQLST